MAASVPYIGSRMSLISKAEIRYEGYLHEIDTVNTTVTLRNVRSFGTEKRRSDKVIPPKDDIFQYIIFRGSDIKDISVCDTPFLDPAIVQSGPPAAGANANNFPQNSQFNAAQPATTGGTSPTQNAFTAFGMPATAPQAKPHPPAAPSPQLFRDLTSNDRQQTPEERVEAALDQLEQPVPEIHRQQSVANKVNQQREMPGSRPQYADQARYTRPPPNRFANNNNNGNFNNRNFDYDNPSRFDRGANYPYGPGGGNRNVYQQHQPRGRGYGNFNGNNSSWGNGGVNRYDKGPRMSKPAPQQVQPATDNLKIFEDFDIEGENNKFDKSLLEKEFSTLSMVEGDDHEEQSIQELEEGEVNAEAKATSDAAKFYDRTKSFFDNISCDALEKRSSRLTTADEKKLNVQTFGVPTVYRNNRQNYNQRNYYNNQRRGGGNYYGGFGGQQQQQQMGPVAGGGGGQNNNNNVNNYTRGPGQNNYYTSNYSTEQSYRRGGGNQANRRQ